MGKFSSELAERLYALSLDSAQDETIGASDELGWYARFNAERAILGEDSQGFVDAEQFETDELLDVSWLAIVDEYAGFYQEVADAAASVTGITIRKG